MVGDALGVPVKVPVASELVSARSPSCPADSRDFRETESSVTKSSRIAIKTKGSILFFDPAEIVLVEAQRNHILLHRLAGSYLLRESISTVARKLEPYGFIRIHRSSLVNTSFVEEIRRWTASECVVRVRGGKELSVSRTYRKNLKSIAQFWIGIKGLLPE